MRSVAAIFGCDCDPDRTGFASGVNETSLSWQGVELGIPSFILMRRRFYDNTGLWPKMTWFVRADHQIKAVHGDAGYCLEKYQPLWRSLEAEGDEIAWHPHLWAWDDKAGRWYQKIGDDEFTHSCLAEGLEAFERSWGDKPKTAHAGWCYQDNETMKFMSTHGLLADCSAVPGHNTLGHGFSDQANWAITEPKPYFPSVENYQVPSPLAVDSLDLLEIPASVGGGMVARGLKILRDQIKRRSLSLRLSGFKKQVPLMTLVPAINRGLISDAISRVSSSELNHFLSYTHCDEFLSRSGKSLFPTLTYSLPAFFSNVAYLETRCRSSNLELNFTTLAQFAVDSLSQYGNRQSGEA